ncbi:MAG: tetratricopeptide repeat protein [Chloroflexota bacterium]
MSEQLPFLIPATNRPQTPVHDFVGRETEINSLVEALNPTDSDSASSGKVAMIYGEAGVGKTELAGVVAYRLSPKFPDALLAIKFGNTGDSDSTLAVQNVLEIVIHTLDPLARLPDNLNELQTLYISLLKGKKILIIVDQVGNENGINLLIPPPTCALLLTSRHQFNLPTAFTLHLNKLSPADAEHLLLMICPRIGLQASVLARLCRYTPLALRLSAALLAYDLSLEMESYIRVLSEQIEQAAIDNDRPEALFEGFIRQIYERLDTFSQQTFCQLGVFLDSFNQTAAAALANTDGIAHKDINHHLDAFSQLNLLAYDEATKFYRIHASIRDFALEHLIDSSETRLHLAQHYANAAEDCATLAHRGSDGVLLSLLIFDDHKFYIKQAWAWLQQQEQKSPVIDAFILRFYKITEAFGRLRFFPEHELLPQIKAALEAAQRLNDREATLSILGNLGRTYYMLGQGQKALDYYEQQLDLARQQGNRGEEARIRHNISLAQALPDKSP